MERGKINLLGGDELIIGIGTNVLDVVDDEGIGESVLCEEDDLGAAGCEGSNGCFTYAAGTALANPISNDFDVVLTSYRLTVTMMTLPCMFRSLRLVAP